MIAYLLVTSHSKPPLSHNVEKRPHFDAMILMKSVRMILIGRISAASRKKSARFDRLATAAIPSQMKSGCPMRRCRVYGNVAAAGRIANRSHNKTESPIYGN